MEIMLQTLHKFSPQYQTIRPKQVHSQTKPKPRGSMYGMFTVYLHFQMHVNIPYMDSMGNQTTLSCLMRLHFGARLPHRTVEKLALRSQAPGIDRQNSSKSSIHRVFHQVLFFFGGRLFSDIFSSLVGFPPPFEKIWSSNWIISQGIGCHGENPPVLLGSLGSRLGQVSLSRDNRCGDACLDAWCFFVLDVSFLGWSFDPCGLKSWLLTAKMIVGCFVFYRSLFWSLCGLVF